MSKTYILEPTEVTITGERIGMLTCPYSDNSLETVFDSISVGSLMDFNSDVLKFAAKGAEFGVLFTIDGTMPEGGPIPGFAYMTVNYRSGGQSMDFPDGTDNVLEFSYYTSLPETVTVSIYTESEDDPEPAPSGLPGLEDKNVVYEYQMLAQNNMKDICLALKELRAAKDPNTSYPENPGYSVMEDMSNTLKDIAVVENNGYAVPLEEEFFNPLEVIATYIRILAVIEQNKSDGNQGMI